jgi:polyisoprenoid-binding protein YceI
MTASSTTSVEVPVAGTYRVDPQRSKVSYSGRHMFGLGVVHATFTLTSGELRVADPLTASTVAVTLDANSFSSNNARRDKDVRSAALLDVATYPEITFAANSLRLDGDQWLAAGTVTAHGKTVPVEVAIDQLTRNGEEIRVHGQAKHLDRYAFGVVKSKGMVGRFLDLDLDVYAVPASRIG